MNDRKKVLEEDFKKRFFMEKSGAFYHIGDGHGKYMISTFKDEYEANLELMRHSNVYEKGWKDCNDYWQAKSDALMDKLGV